nr:immunoglobulin heavy chain junction region [Macaca mulatta]MOV43721.1 immunoglobulin heavy chain junction region [Macaca mulatta]MOV46094.1 immunoglobulin heavy chain junction region [Macaca mulatta]MOV46668.1 immunoglobulin heavy chain junction region [Macaca mulatta]MOV46905.1 immunoglobulin heavy chain junction region [Macaca mulatta]
CAAGPYAYIRGAYFDSW